MSSQASKSTIVRGAHQNFESLPPATLAPESKDNENCFTTFDYAHCLYPVKWIDWKNIAPDDWVPAVPRQGIKGISQLRQDAEAIEHRWNAYEEGLHGNLPWNRQWLDERLDRLRTLKRELEMSEIDDIFSVGRQVILFGPPGTGKTYKARQIAARLLQFSERSDDFKKSRFSQGGYWEIVQFHPSYNYEDFVRGIAAKPSNGQLEYRPVNRIFAEMCIAAASKKDAKYALIIDEINRANVPAVLGELLYGLEYRGEPVTTLYPPSDPYDAKDKPELIVPKNLYVIGTMNTADRSIGHLDYAIRRRFAFFPCRAKRDELELFYDEFERLRSNNNLRQSALEKFDKVARLFDNQNLSTDYRAEDVQVGHTYFMADSEAELRAKFKYQVVPLLTEYLADGVFRPEAKSRIDRLGE